MILDSLLVKLGFTVDKKGLDEFHKKAFDVKKAMVGIGSALAVAGIGEWIGHAVERLADVQKLSEVLQMPAKSIAALNKVAAENEVPLEGMTSTLETLTRTAGQAALGIGRGAMIFKKLGLHAKDSHGHVKSFNELLGDVADKMQGKSRTEQLGIASRLGIDEHLLNILGQGRQKIQELTAAAEKANPLKESDYEAALKTEKLFAKTKASIGAVSNQIAVKLLPVIDDAFTAITKWFAEARNSEAFASLIRMVVDLSRDLGYAVGIITTMVGLLAKWAPAATIVKGIIGGMIAMKFVGWLQGVAGAGVAAAKSLGTLLFTAKGLQTLLGGALIVAIGLIIEDLWQFYNGGLSVTGLLVTKWAPALTLIKVGLGLIAAAFIALKVAALYSMPAIGVSTVAVAAPLFLWLVAIGAVILGIYELKKHWTEVFDYIAEKANKLIDVFNKMSAYLGIDPIQHIVTNKDISEKDKKLAAMQGHFKRKRSETEELSFLVKTDKDGHAIKGRSKLASDVWAKTNVSQLIRERSESKAATHVHTTHVTVQKVEIKTDNPAEMGKQFTREVTRNAQTKTVL